ncbi:outer membrane lipoprotein-sorting protein [Parahaliea mediterranea]|uniref:Outer membrane lipoprotein-sorting protein n=1 Tax=Parahaliea mediterranea TaxID=651086 RepID=A0A939DFT9_9GAMM|nr:outer membrane lipoprotein-sorting protein [Parahaliea mediterranea]MBN7797468.1 outer membrane lipoprotein-sorting protein [Parahaliea mediterranea]
MKGGAALLNGVLAAPRRVLALGALVLALAAAFVPALEKDVRSDAFLSPDDPAIVAREQVKRQFGLSDPLVVALDAGQPEAVYSPANLALLADIAEAVKALPNIDRERVFSLATESNIAATPDGLAISPFLDPPPASRAQAEHVRVAVSRFPLYLGSLVAEDGSMALTVVELKNESLAEQSYRQLRQVLLDLPRPPGTTLHLAGEGAISGYMGSYVDQDAQRLIPVAWLIITAVVFLGFRRLGPALYADVIMLFTVVSTVGLMAALGIKFYVISNALPVILIGIAVADTIHVVSHYDELRARATGESHRELVSRAVREMWRPVTITSLTTMAGFAGLALASFMPPFRYFGWFAALGVGLAWLYTLVILPALMVLFTPRAAVERAREGGGQDRRGLAGALSRLGEGTLDSSGRVLLLAGVLVAAGLYAATRLQVDDDPIGVFHRDEPVAVADRLINARMDGTNTLDVVVEAPEAEGLFDPRRLRRIEALQAYIETLPHVGGTVSIVDYLKQMNRALNDDDPAYYRIPDSADSVAQFFLLYAAMSDPADFEEEVDYDYRSANVRVYATAGGYRDTRPLVEGVRDYVARHFGDGDLAASISGRLYINYRWIKGLADSHFGGLLLSLVMVWAVSALLFRSLLAGCLTLVPVVASVLVVYAVMGLAGITLGMGTSMFAAIAVGLGIDFAIHTLDRLRSLGRTHPDDPRRAFVDLYPGTGRALLYNALAVACGFGILVFSKIVSLTTFGWIVMMAIVTSFIASMTLLPALLWRLQPSFLRPDWTPARPGLRWAAVLLTCALAIFLVGGAAAAEESPTADEIVASMNAVGADRSLSRKVRMVLTDSRGKQRDRETVSYRKRFEDSLRTVVFYLAPANVRGTAFLTWDYDAADREDDQWLYLPALRKSRRIPAADRGDYFLGTDLTYEDIKLDGKLAPVDYHFALEGSERDGDYLYYLLRGEPRSEAIAGELGYSRIEVRVDASTWLAVEVAFFDLQGQPLKTLEVTGIVEVDGTWTREGLEVSNHQTGHTTRFEFYDIAFDGGIDDSLFTRQALERGR